MRHESPESFFFFKKEITQFGKWKRKKVTEMETFPAHECEIHILSSYTEGNEKV